MTPVVEFAGVELTYPGPPPVQAVRACDLTIHAGEHIAVVGTSGSGKSSLLNVVGLLDVHTAGTYRLDGAEVADLSDVDRTGLRARLIGFVFQSFHLLPHRTAAENVMLGLMYAGVPRRHRRTTACEALERVGLGHRIDAVPSHLSGGERQRVAIARALAPRPALLLCDEPTGNLDSSNAQSVLDLIVELNGQGVTTVVITHDQSVAARAGRVLRMHDGWLS